MKHNIHKVDIEGVYHNTRWPTVEKPTSNIIINRENKSSSSKIWYKKRMPTLTSSIQHRTTEILATAIRQEKEIKKSKPENKT